MVDTKFWVLGVLATAVATASGAPSDFSRHPGWPSALTSLMSAGTTPCNLESFLAKASFGPGDGYLYDSDGGGFCRSIPAKNVPKVQAALANQEWISADSLSCNVYLPVSPVDYIVTWSPIQSPMVNREEANAFCASQGASLCKLTTLCPWGAGLNPAGVPKGATSVPIQNLNQTDSPGGVQLAGALVRTNSDVPAENCQANTAPEKDGEINMIPCCKLTPENQALQAMQAASGIQSKVAVTDKYLQEMKAQLAVQVAAGKKSIDTELVKFKEKVDFKRAGWIRDYTNATMQDIETAEKRIKKVRAEAEFNTAKEIRRLSRPVEKAKEVYEKSLVVPPDLVALRKKSKLSDADRKEVYQKVVQNIGMASIYNSLKAKKKAADKKRKEERERVNKEINNP